MSVYLTERGYELFLSRNFGCRIAAFRRHEKRLLERCLSGRDAVVEMGCGRAELLRFAVGRGLGYVGIDPSERYLERAARTISPAIAARVDLVRSYAEEPSHWLPALRRYDRPILIMPFNCLGNVSDPVRVLTILCRQDLDVIVSLFNSEASTSRQRRAYYRRSGYRVSLSQDGLGARFHGPGGLSTYGFRIPALLSRVRATGLFLRATGLGPLGSAVTNFSVSDRGFPRG